MKSAIAYFRVSTAKQGQSGLGLEAQQSTVRAYCRATGLTISSEFTEIETGTRKKKRPQFDAAIHEAKAAGAVLVIAKLDRLARDVRVVSELMDSGVDFVAVDMPDANKLTIHIMAALAEHEARLISVRTREALAAAKARGTKLGGPKGFTPEAQAMGPQAMRSAAVEAMRQPTAFARSLKEQGYSLHRIAATLTESGFTTRKGKAWHATQVRRILAREAA